MLNFFDQSMLLRGTPAAYRAIHLEPLSDHHDLETEFAPARHGTGRRKNRDQLKIRPEKHGRWGETSPEDVRDAVINLSPWFSRKGAGSDDREGE